MMSHVVFSAYGPEAIEQCVTRNNQYRMYPYLAETAIIGAE